MWWSVCWLFGGIGMSPNPLGAERFPPAGGVLGLAGALSGGEGARVLDWCGGPRGLKGKRCVLWAVKWTDIDLHDLGRRPELRLHVLLGAIGRGDG